MNFRHILISVAVKTHRALLVLLLIVAFALHSGTAAAEEQSDSSDFVARVVARTNMYRAQFGCQALIISDQLNSSAQAHSDDMAQHDFFAHNGSDGSTPFDRMHTAGYAFRLAAENVAAGYTTPEEVVDGWFNEVAPDDGHRQNILNCNLTEIGVGYTYLADDPGEVQYQSYWTQDFGTRP